MIKINELIEKLNEIKTEHGNLPVYCSNSLGVYRFSPIVNFNVTSDKYGKFLTLEGK